MSTLDLLKKIYAEFEALPPALHPDFKVHALGSSPIAGDYEGLDGLVAHMTDMQERSGGTMQLDAHTFMADGDWGMVISRVTATRDGKSLDVQGVGVWELKDGKLLKHWETASDPAAWDAFWS